MSHTLIPYHVKFEDGDWWDYAILLGAHRTKTGFKKRRNAAHGANQSVDRFDKDIVGALGECAFATWAELPLPPFQTTCDLDGDVSGYHVRATPYTFGAMPVHKKDPDTGVFIHVTMDYGDLQALIWGWSYGEDAKCAPYTDAKQRTRYAHWIEIENPIMRDMDELPDV